MGMFTVGKCETCGKPRILLCYYCKECSAKMLRWNEKIMGGKLRNGRTEGRHSEKSNRAG